MSVWIRSHIGPGHLELACCAASWAVMLTDLTQSLDNRAVGYLMRSIGGTTPQSAQGHIAKRLTAPMLRACAILTVTVVGLSPVACDQNPAQQQLAALSKPKIGLPPAGAAKPNVIFILVDTLRADRLGAYGNKHELTPTMDAIAKEGVLFERAFAPAPWTLPSVASMITCYFPRVHKCLSYREVEDMNQGRKAKVAVLQDKFFTLAEMMKSAGYDTAGFVANKFLIKEFGFAQGFDHYDSAFAENTVRGELVNNAATTWLKERKSDKPLFMYLHYMDVHGPYNAAAKFMDPLMAEVEKIPVAKRRLLSKEEAAKINPYLQVPPPDATDPARHERLKGYWEYWAARYEAGVRECDFYIGQLVEQLKAAGLWDNAYVILTADHGEALCEHGYWDHGYTLMQSDLHIPLVLRWPGVLPAGGRSQQNVDLMDIMPTLAEQLGRPIEPLWQGESLIPVISQIPPMKPRVLFADAIKTNPDMQQAAIRDDWKYVRINLPERKNRNGETIPAETKKLLTNFIRDQAESTSVLSSNSVVARELEEALDAQNIRNADILPGMAQTAEVSGDVQSKLNAVGYVGESSGEEESANQSGSKPASAPASQPAKKEKP